MTWVGSVLVRMMEGHPLCGTGIINFFNIKKGRAVAVPFLMKTIPGKTTGNIARYSFTLKISNNVMKQSSWEQASLL